MEIRKSSIITLVILMTAFFPTSISFAQSWGEIILGVGSALLENHIDNSNRYSSQDKESMKNTINDLNKSINVNQNARNATRDVNQGNYTGAIIQGTQTIMNATGNHDYDTYLNSANQINRANREYEQDIQNGMNKDEALDKRNTTVGYSTAESIIELQDRIAQERLEKARQQREAEHQLQESNYYHETPSYSETNTSTSSYNSNRLNVTSDNLSRKESNYSKNVGINRSYNSIAKTLSRTNSIIIFKTDDGEHVSLNIPVQITDKNLYLFYKNQGDKAIRFCCNRASVTVKHYGDNNDETYTGTCSFVMPAHSDSKIALSALFPNLSNTSSIERIKMLFVDTQIIDVVEFNENNKSGRNSNSIQNNSNTQLLTKNRIVKFNTDEGGVVALGIDDEFGRLFYNNLYNDRDVTLTCDKANIKVKYFGEETEYNFTDVCSFVMRSNTYDYLEWSDVFFNLSETKQIENIKVQFLDVQIK